MARIVPAILTDDPGALALMVRRAERFATYVQVDITDGIFVPSRSISYEDVEKVSPKFSWEAHLMVVSPEEYFPGFKKAGAGKVIFHYEATMQHGEVIDEARRLGLGVGLGVNPETPISAFERLIPSLDSVLFLSVQPGFYGSEFIPEVIGKVAAMRYLFPEIKVGIDGGINDKNISDVLKSEADDICVGSAIFRSTDPEASYRRLAGLIGAEA